MYPEDRVLVGVMPEPRDLEIARERQWYRIPARQLPDGIHAEYLAFYFTKRFPESLRWAIHFYARRTGHELVRRKELFPDESAHPRANDLYYLIQLGPLRSKVPPIVSKRWRRITFIQTTWDRFVSAKEINDLFRSDNTLVDRVYHALRNRGIHAERAVEVSEGNKHYLVEIVIPCQNGTVMLAANNNKPNTALPMTDTEDVLLARIDKAMRQRGGPLLVDLNF
jgi:hypothetical protein